MKARQRGSQVPGIVQDGWLLFLSMSSKSDLSARICLRVPAGLHKRLKMEAVLHGVPMGTLIEKMLDDQAKRMERAQRRQASPLHRPAALDDEDER